MEANPSARSGIYVEILICCDLEQLWRLTQQPSLHQQWDLRFSEIEYLPRPSEDEPQRFLYATRIGFGLRIRGSGESVGERATDTGERTSALKFSSSDRKSLIRQGSGYWRYIPREDGIRFLTWYDYKVRFGVLGRLTDRIVFRPLMGWATAWSFDRLRLWLEAQQSPQVSTTFAVIHAITRITIALIWVWHGLVPKLIFRHVDEQLMLAQAGISVRLLPWIGLGELVIALLVLVTWRFRAVFAANATIMAGALLAVCIHSPQYVRAAFNPVTLNIAIIALSAIGYLAAGRMPSASRCERRPARSER